MKIYTKTGDKGQTSLIGGTRVAKNSVRLEAYGSVDELNSYIGLVRSFPISSELKEELVAIQNTLFSIGGNLATDTSVQEVRNNLVVTEEEVVYLEKAIDRMNETLPPLAYFVLPGGSQASSVAHIARTVCRRVERRVLDVAAQYEVDEAVIRYINRLSDYLFVVARKICYDDRGEELKWELTRK